MHVDPTRATSDAFNRRTFVGLAAASAAASAVALAGDTLGKPHPPLVAEDDPSIVIDRPTFKQADGTIGAYAARPKNATTATPGVVVVMHIWGVDAQIRDVVRRLATAGYAAIAPDLYGRLAAPSGDGVTDIGVFRPFARKLDREQFDGDVREAASWLRSKSPKGKVAAMGFCMGGALTLVQAIDNGDVLAAAVPFYGAVADVDPNKIHVPICGSYGERDTSIPPADVRAFRDKLRVPNDVKIYPEAGHAFFDDTRGAYVASAAHDAWSRTLTFFKEHLGQQA